MDRHLYRLGSYDREGEQPDSESVPRRRWRVLVADEDPVIRARLVEWINNDSDLYDVVEAASDEPVLVRLASRRDGRFDLVILGRQEGVHRLIALLRHRHPKVKVVVVRRQGDPGGPDADGVSGGAIDWALLRINLRGLLPADDLPPVSGASQRDELRRA